VPITTNTRRMIYNTPALGMLSGAGGHHDRRSGRARRPDPAITNNGKSLQMGGNHDFRIPAGQYAAYNQRRRRRAFIRLRGHARRSRATHKRGRRTIHKQSTARSPYPKGSKETSPHNGTIATTDAPWGTQGPSSGNTGAIREHHRHQPGYFFQLKVEDTGSRLRVAPSVPRQPVRRSNGWFGTKLLQASRWAGRPCLP